MLFLDGVYVTGGDALCFRRVPRPTATELDELIGNISARVGRYLERQGLLVRNMDDCMDAGGRATHGAVAGNSYLAREAGDDAGLDDLLSHSITYRIAVGLQQGRKAFTFARRSHRVSVAGAQARTGRQRRNIRPCPGHSA